MNDFLQKVAAQGFGPTQLFHPEELYSQVHVTNVLQSLPKHKKLLFTSNPDTELYYVISAFDRTKIEFVYATYVEKTDAVLKGREFLIYHHPALDTKIAQTLALNISARTLNQHGAMVVSSRQPIQGLPILRTVLESAVQNKPKVCKHTWDGVVEREIKTITNLREVFPVVGEKPSLDTHPFGDTTFVISA